MKIYPEKLMEMLWCYEDAMGISYHNKGQYLGEWYFQDGSEFTYIGTIISEDGNLVKEFKRRRKKGNAVSSQLWSQVFNKKEVSSGTGYLVC